MIEPLIKERKNTKDARYRVTSNISYTSAHKKRKMSGDNVYKLYKKLKDKLSVVEPFGMNVPNIRKKNTLDDYPLAYRKSKLKGNRRTCEFPIILIWNPNGKEKPTFKQFCEAYNIEIIED